MLAIAASVADDVEHLMKALCPRATRKCINNGSNALLFTQAVHIALACRVRERGAKEYSRLLVEHEDIRTALEKSVGSREAGKTTTDDDNLGHDDNEKFVVGGREEDKRRALPGSVRGL